MNDTHGQSTTQEPGAGAGQLPGAAASRPAARAESPPPRNRVARILIVALVLLGVVLVMWRLFFATPRLPAGIVPLSGRIEGDDSAVAPKTGGRILEMSVREGDTVK